MAEVADYQWLVDGSFDLPNGNDGNNKEISFSLPIDLASSAKGVLTYVIDRVGADPVTHTMQLNSTSELGPQTVQSGRRVLQEVVTGMKIGGNTLVVERQGAGTIRVSDIVLWFQRNGI